MDRADLEHWKGREVARLLALVDSERRYYQEIIAAAPMPLAIVSSQGELLSANRALKHLLNIRPEELRRRTLVQVIPAPEIEAAIHDACDRGTAHENLPLQLGGRAFRISVIPFRTWAENGEYEALVTFRDEGGQAEHPPELADLPAVFWALDAEKMHFTSVSGAAEELMGFTSDHWIPAPGFWLERIDPADRAAVSDFYAAAMRRDGIHSCEFRARTATGRIVWCRETFRVVLDPAGRMPRVKGITLEVSGRRRSELDSIQANRVEALIGLSRRLTHDLNNALMIVTGYAEELLAYFGPEHERRADVAAILSAAETMAGITGELHGFTRKQSVAPGEADLSMLLPAVGARIRDELGAVLVMRMPEPPLVAVADPTQLDAVLLSFARAVRHKNDPHMILAAAYTHITELPNLPHTLGPGAYIDIVFRGPVESEVQPAAFETLLAGRDPHGSAMARAFAIIREWGGSVRTMRTEHMSELHVLLPAVVPQASAEPVAEPEPEPKPVREPAPTQPEMRSAGTVLVVEDERGIRSLVRKILDREGFEVIDAAGAEEAVEAAREHQGSIGLLITDVGLQGATGQELVRQLRAERPHLRVLYISGYTEDPEVITEGLDANSAFLQKPFTLSALMKKVRSAFDARGATCEI